MSHTWRVGETKFVGNSDFSELCLIQGKLAVTFGANPSPDGSTTIVVPFKDLIKFMATQLGMNIISAIDHPEMENLVLRAVSSRGAMLLLKWLTSDLTTSRFSWRNSLNMREFKIWPSKPGSP